MKYIGKFIVWLIVGLVVAGIGLGIFLASLPSSDDFGNPQPASTSGVIGGVVLLGIGQMIFLVFTIATGVFLGTREAHFEQADA